MCADERPRDAEVNEALDAMRVMFDVERDTELLRLLCTLFLCWPEHRRGGIHPMVMLATAASARDIAKAKKSLGITSDTQWLQIATAVLRSIALAMDQESGDLRISRQSLLEAIQATSQPPT